MKKTLTAIIFVCVATLLQAQITCPSTVYINQRAKFENFALGDNFKWDFGNFSRIEGVQNPSYIYKQTGFYTVSCTSYWMGVLLSVDYCNVLVSEQPVSITEEDFQKRVRTIQYQFLEQQSRSYYKHWINSEELPQQIRTLTKILQAE